MQSYLCGGVVAVCQSCLLKICDCCLVLNRMLFKQLGKEIKYFFDKVRKFWSQCHVRELARHHLENELGALSGIALTIHTM